MSLLAIDMGTSSCKAVAFSDDGGMLAQASHSYSPESPQPRWSEMAPEKFWQAFTSAVRAIVSKLPRDEVEVVGISSHAETFFPTDSAGHTLGPAILNADSRAVAEAAWVTAQIGREKLFAITGLAPHPMYPLPKILWLRKHKPEIFRSAVRYLTVPGYLLTRLGLPGYVDYSLASRFLAFDIRRREWSEEILSASQLSPDLLPQPLAAGTLAGELSEKAATGLGLAKGTPVILGGHDQPCAALGSGVLGPGRVSASLGTYECLVGASETPSLSPEAFASNLNSYCHVVPNRFVTLAYFPSGIMVEWLLRVLHPVDQPSAPAATWEVFRELEAHASSKPTGLCITPHLLGSCNPDFNPQASGVIAGLRPSTTPSDLYKGVLEGIACEFANMTDLLRRTVGAFQAVYVSGGGARSGLGLELRAAVANCELRLLQCPEAVCLGTAILAGVTIGKFRSFEDAVASFVRESGTIVPDSSVSASYQFQKAEYQLLYSSLAPLRQAREKVS